MILEYKHDFYNKFTSILNSIDTYLVKNEVKVSRGFSQNLGSFTGLSHETQKKIIENSQTYLNSLIFATENGWTLNDDKTLFWNALKFFKLSCSHDFLEHFTKGCVVEIYNMENIQVWRNLKVFELSSYSLEDMFCFSWEDRYTRCESATEQIISVLGQVFQSKEPTTVMCDIHNVIKENSSQELFNLDANHKFVSLLIDKNKCPAGYAVITEAKLIGLENSQFKSESLNPFVSKDF